MREQDSEQSDEKIAGLVQAGDFEFFSVLVRRYEKKIKRYARKFLADNEDINDVVQEIFLKTYENIQSFDIKRKFSTWLYRIAHNELVNVLKKKSRLPFFFSDLDIFLPYRAAKENIENDFKKQETRDLVNKELNGLETKYREPLILYYFEEMSYKQISDIMRIPISTVGVRIKRGKEKMKINFLKQKKI